MREILSTEANISGANLAPNYWPMHLYQICRIERQLGIPIYEFTVDAKLDYQIWFHFAKIDPTVINAGLCVFNVSINGLTVVDVCECLDFKVRFGSKGWRTGFGRKQF